MTFTQNTDPHDLTPVKRYRHHRCDGQHATWPDLAACIWPHATIDGNGPIGAASCGARTITLYPTADQAQAHKHDYDRDGCRPRCHRHHHIVDLTRARQNALPAKPTSTVTRRPTKAAAPPPHRPVVPTCGQPRTNGEPCRRPQGWGADTPGVGPCRDHGGSITERLAEKERRVEQALAYARGLEETTPVLEVAVFAPGFLGSLLAELSQRLGGEA